MRAAATVIGGGALVAIVACGSFGSDDPPAESPDAGSAVEGGGPAVDASVTDGATSPDAGDPACVGCERFVFATKQQLYGDFGGVAAADALCAMEANAADSVVKGHVFLAWISTKEVSAADRVVRGTGAYKLPSGATLADTFEELLALDLATPIKETSDGVSFSSQKLWTGTYPDGGKHALATCDGWTNQGGDAVFGSSTETKDGQWTFAGLDSCATNHRVYCIEN